MSEAGNSMMRAMGQIAGKLPRVIDPEELGKHVWAGVIEYHCPFCDAELRAAFLPASYPRCKVIARKSK